MSPLSSFSVCADRHAVLPALSPLPISLMFFSHNKSGPDFLKQTMLWGLSPPITLCQFQSGLKYDSTVCASPSSKSSPPAPFPLSCSFTLCYLFLRPCNCLHFFPNPSKNLSSNASIDIDLLNIQYKDKSMWIPEHGMWTPNNYIHLLMFNISFQNHMLL